MPFFSIIIPTRNRPTVVTEAVHSVFAQDFEDIEVLVIDDGSSDPLALEDLDLDPGDVARLRIVHLDSQREGCGPSYTRNVGIWSSGSKFCAFLDDDDSWIKNDHLSSAYRALTDKEQEVDLYLSNQEALSPDGVTTRRLWLGPLAEAVLGENRPLQNGCCKVSVEELIATSGFCHLNTTIVRRELLEKLGGLDVHLGYEEDLDFYLRAIDKARNILFYPDIVARHNVPDQTRRNNASTLVDRLGRLNIRLYILNKNMLSASRECIVRYCENFWVETLRVMVDICVKDGNYLMAYKLSRRSLSSSFSIKWRLYTIYLCLKSAFVKEA